MVGCAFNSSKRSGEWWTRVTPLGKQWRRGSLTLRGVSNGEGSVVYADCSLDPSGESPVPNTHLSRRVLAGIPVAFRPAACVQVSG